MATRSMADAVRAILVKRAFQDAAAMGGGMPPGGAPMDPAAMGMPPGGAPMDPSMMGMPPADPMAGLGGAMPPGDPMAGSVPQSGMINMTADEFTKFIKQMMAAFGASGAQQPAQQAQPDISSKLDTLIAVMQAQGRGPAM